MLVDKPRVFSVGYERLKPPDLLRLVTALDVVLWDVRSRPSGRVKKGFGKADLITLLGARYEWHGDRLGGFAPGITTKGIDHLVSDPRRIMCMCMEAAPGDCHRHQIGLRVALAGVVMHHVYLPPRAKLTAAELITAADLEAAIKTDSDDIKSVPLASLFAPSLFD